MPYCSNCGQQVPSGFSYCPTCTPKNYQPQGTNFFASLFDISMKEMVTPKIIPIIFIIGIIVIGLSSLAAIINLFNLARYAGAGPVIAGLVFVPLGALISIILLRVYLEVILLLFKMYDKLKEIKTGLGR